MPFQMMICSIFKKEKNEPEKREKGPVPKQNKYYNKI